MQSRWLPRRGGGRNRAHPPNGGHVVTPESTTFRMTQSVLPVSHVTVSSPPTAWDSSLRTSERMVSLLRQSCFRMSFFML